MICALLRCLLLPVCWKQRKELINAMPWRKSFIFLGHPHLKNNCMQSLIHHACCDTRYNAWLRALQKFYSSCYGLESCSLREYPNRVLLQTMLKIGAWSFVSWPCERICLKALRLLLNSFGSLGQHCGSDWHSERP